MNKQILQKLIPRNFKIREATLNKLRKAKGDLTWDELFNKLLSGSTGSTGSTKEVAPVAPVKKTPGVNEIIGLFKEINPTYDQLYANKTQRNAVEYLIKKFTYKKMKNLMSQLPEILQEPYSPQITTPLQLKNKFAQLMQFCKKRSTEQQSNKLRSV